MTTDKQILITGAAGFGGSRLARALLDLGHSVTGLDVVGPNHASALRNEICHPNFREHYVNLTSRVVDPSTVVGWKESSGELSTGGEGWDGYSWAGLSGRGERGLGKN